ncbi:hypothetical protein C8F01DRAFT_1162240 [Mycena amicta]|nr:hypothetical protein C8F01DRAFT_1162240 [Mycena amicta]
MHSSPFRMMARYPSPPPLSPWTLISSSRMTILSSPWSSISSARIQSWNSSLVDGPSEDEVGTLTALQLPTSLRSLTTGYLPLVKWIVALDVPPTHINTLSLVNAGNSSFPWEDLNALLSGPIANNLHTLVFTDIDVEDDYRLDFSNFHLWCTHIPSSKKGRVPYSTLLTRGT